MSLFPFLCSIWQNQWCLLLHLFNIWANFPRNIIISAVRKSKQELWHYIEWQTPSIFCLFYYMDGIQRNHEDDEKASFYRESTHTWEWVFLKVLLKSQHSLPGLGLCHNRWLTSVLHAVIIQKEDEPGKFTAWVESKWWWESSRLREVNGIINLIYLTGND